MDMRELPEKNHGILTEDKKAKDEKIKMFKQRLPYK